MISPDVFAGVLYTISIPTLWFAGYFLNDKEYLGTFLFTVIAIVMHSFAIGIILSSATQ